MRFAAKYRRYRVTARQEVKMTLANGKENIIQHGVICAFDHGGPFEVWEKEQAQSRFKFKGTTQERDESTPVNPLARLSLYDTESSWLVAQWAEWDKHEGNPVGTIKREVEEFLRDYRANGVEYIELVPEPVAAPWPTYDEISIHGQRTAAKVAEKNIEIARATGISLDAVIAYEKQNRNDERILEAYEAALAEDMAGEPEEELVEA